VDQIRAAAEAGSKDAQAVMLWHDTYLATLDIWAAKRGVTEEDLRAEITRDPAGFIRREIEHSAPILPKLGGSE
jgi:hypothetical protein